ncbi:Succinate dehydrogenase subunit 3-1-mitochondrial [Striga hermonthica]|uniref:Succinate dehydrogenase subunit 3-1-mitochondrial n=1 Tax=Striga hermonthica TaxID=68872 RepID=A0A9N7RS40_STRHE|nr:Succinate dehydrogenase subunit 3-1-mitochondrial [Striga hermonthica]
MVGVQLHRHLPYLHLLRLSCLHLSSNKDARILAHVKTEQPLLSRSRGHSAQGLAATETTKWRELRGELAVDRSKNTWWGWRAGDRNIEGDLPGGEPAAELLYLHNRSFIPRAARVWTIAAATIPLLQFCLCVVACGFDPFSWRRNMIIGQSSQYSTVAVEIGDVADTCKEENLKKHVLRPLSPHLPIYKPQLSSTTSILNRISGVYLTAYVLGFYLVPIKLGSVSFSYEDEITHGHMQAPGADDLVAARTKVATWLHGSAGEDRLKATEMIKAMIEDGVRVWADRAALIPNLWDVMPEPSKTGRISFTSP